MYNEYEMDEEYVCEFVAIIKARIPLSGEVFVK
jgi:hypothetical protein